MIESLRRLLAAGTQGPWHTGRGDHWARDVRDRGGHGIAFCGHIDASDLRAYDSRKAPR